ncbi:hypothetical protein KAR91_81555 [Candidatus Pacearchaeota archaeon]|nr:hypothetical protein [Candidatus Pacearchaeota archaeon]
MTLQFSNAKLFKPRTKNFKTALDLIGHYHYYAVLEARKIKDINEIKTYKQENEILFDMTEKLFIN